MSLIRLSLFTLILLGSGFEVFSQNQEGIENPGGTRNSAPVVDPFKTKGDLAGMAQSSVSLLSGDVGFPVSLGSITTNGGLSFDFTTTYSSNIDRQVETWNLEAPTGLLGLGWTTPVNKIIVDNKGTGVTDDDEYFWVNAGTPNRLIFKNTIVGYYYNPLAGNQASYFLSEYSIKNDIETKIIFDPFKQLWKITYSNGTILQFGGRSDLDRYSPGLDLYDIINFDASINHPSNGNSIEWGVKWGNWIGNSSVNGQTNFASAWNLSKIQNPTGNFIEFLYNNKLEFVGKTDNDSTHTFRKHTKSCYLTEVKDQFNRKLVFKYTGKLAEEYVDPHQEQVEPDAYQEKVDSVFLSMISFVDSDTLEKTKLDYSFIGTGDFKKRILTSIEKINKNNLSSPKLKFDYFNEANEDKGKIQKITYPQGGSIEYTYQLKTLGKSARDLQIAVPTGYSEPRVWTQDEYTIVTFRKPSTNELKLQVFEWVGYWKSAYSTDFPNIELVVYNDKKFQDFEIFPGKDFFTVIRNYYNGTINKSVNLIKRTENNGQWISEFFTFSTKGEGTSLTDKENNDANNMTMVVNGENYSFIYCPPMGSFSLFVYKNSAWERNDEDNSVFGGRPFLTDVRDYDYGAAMPFRFFATGMNNYIFIHDKKTSNSNSVDKWYIIYLDQNKDIKLGSLHSSGTDLTRDWSNLYPSPGSVYELTMNTQAFYFNWDEFYTLNEHPLDAIGNKSEIYAGNQQIGIIDNKYPAHVFLYRHNGVELVGDRIDFTYYYYGTLAEDYALAFSKPSNVNNPNYFSQIYYNPNTNLFEKTTIYRPKNQKDLKPTAGINYYINDDTLFFKLPTQGSPMSWSRMEIMPSNLFEFNRFEYSRTGPAFLIMHTHGNSGPSHKNAIIFIKNGSIYQNKQIKIDDDPVFPELLHNALHYPQVSNMMSNTTVVSHQNVTYFKDATWVKLHRIINEEVNGNLTDRPVVSFKVSTGTQELTTTIDYDLTKAITDPSGSVAQYHKVKVKKGTGTGYTETYFVNGIPASEYLKPLTQEGGSNELSNLELLKGTPYKSFVYNEGGVEVSSSETKFKTTTFPIGSTNIGYLVRPVLTKSTQEGLTVSQTQTFNSTGQAVSSSTTNSDGKLHKSESKYASDLSIYTDLKTDFNIDPVVQTVKWVGGKVVSSTVTTWKSWGGYWAPNNTFNWLRVAGQTSVPPFDFVAGSADGKPNVSGWKLSGKVEERTSNGTPIVTWNPDDTYSSVVLAFKEQIPVASFSFGKRTQNSLGGDVSYLGFESNNTVAEDNDYWSFYATTLNTLVGGAFAGEKAMRVASKAANGNQNVYGPTRDFLPTNQKGKYLISGWVRTQSGFVSGNGFLIVHTKRNTDANNDWYPATIPYAGTNITPSTTWQYVQTVIDLGKIRTTNNLSDAELLRIRVYPENRDPSKYLEVDEIRVRPLGSSSEITIYDPVYKIPVQKIDSYNRLTSILYNNWFQPVSSVEFDGQVRSWSSTYEAIRSGAAISLTNLNTSISISAQSGGEYHGFKEGVSTNWTLTNISKINNQLKKTGANVGTAVLNKTFGSEVAARVIIVPDAGSTLDYAMRLGNYRVQRTASKWELFDQNYQLLASDPTTPMATDWTLITQYASNGYWLLFIGDGKIIFRKWVTTTLTTAQLSFTIGTNARGSIDEVIVLNKPILNISLSDGAGNPVQQQVINNTDVIVSGVLYDNKNRPAVKPKPAKYTLSPSTISTLPGLYQSNYAIFDWGTNTLSGSCQVSLDHPQDSTKAFTMVQFGPTNDDPFGRVSKTSLPGRGFEFNSGHLSETILDPIEPGLKAIGFDPANYSIKETVSFNGIRKVELYDKLNKNVFNETITNTIQIAGSMSVATGPRNLGIRIPSSLQMSFTVTKTEVTEANPNLPLGNTKKSSTALDEKFVNDYDNEGEGFHLYVKNAESGQVIAWNYCPIPLSFGTNVVTQTVTFNGIIPNLISIEIVPSANALIQHTAKVDWTYSDYVSDKAKTEYTDYGQVSRVFPPNYFSPRAGEPDVNRWISTFSYDNEGRLISSFLPDQGTVQTKYDKYGRTRVVMNAEGDQPTGSDNVQYSKYDEFSRVIETGYINILWTSITQANLDDPSWPLNNPTWRVKYVYDGEPSADGLTMTYREPGLIYQRLTNSDTDVTSENEERWVYDTKANVTAKKVKVIDYKTTEYSTQYTYDLNGRVSKITYPSGYEVTHAYDKWGRLFQVGTPTDPDYYADYTYDFKGIPTTERINTSGSYSKTISYLYSPQGWLTQLNAGFYKEDLSYTSGKYGAPGEGFWDGKIASVVHTYFWVATGNPEVPASFTQNFDYNLNGWLQSADFVGASLDGKDWGVGAGNQTTYDAHGNFLKIREGSSTYNYVYYPYTNQVKNINGSVTAKYTYNRNGEMTADVDGGIVKIWYDPATGAVTQIDKPSLPIYFQYDGINRRVLKSIPGSSNKTLYLHGATDYVMQEIEMTGTTETVREYIYGRNGIIAFRTASVNHFVIKDHLGSTRVVFNGTTGVIEDYYDYEVFGETARSRETANLTQYRFTGQEWDEETSYYNYKARLYSPKLGRFFSVDPAGQTFGLYNYAGNNPVLYVDPDGEWFWVALAIVYGAYQGHEIGKEAGKKGWDLVGYTVLGAAVGGASGFIGAEIAAMDFVGSGTLGLIAGSTYSSYGMYELSGRKRDFTSSVGFGTMNWSKGRFDYFMDGDNTVGEDVGYFFAGLTNLSDAFRFLDNKYGIEDNMYKEWSDAGKSLNKEDEVLDQNSLRRNYGGTTTNGARNALVKGGSEKNIYYKPFRGHSFLDIPGGIHDPYWTKNDLSAGFTSLATKTKTIPGDWRFVGQHFFLATKYLTTQPIEAMKGYGIGGVFGFIITSKTFAFGANVMYGR